MIGDEYERTVTVGGKSYVISIHQSSKTVWVAVGVYMGKRFGDQTREPDVRRRWLEESLQRIGATSNWRVER